MLLIVDDNELNRDVLANIFGLTYRIETAENGREGLDKLNKHRTELCAVLLDVVMPVMGGIEVLEELSKTQVASQIPIFLITGETDSQIIKKAYELGVMDVIPKPVSPYIVQRRVNSVTVCGAQTPEQCGRSSERPDSATDRTDFETEHGDDQIPLHRH